MDALIDRMAAAKGQDELAKIVGENILRCRSPPGVPAATRGATAPCFVPRACRGASRACIWDVP